MANALLPTYVVTLLFFAGFLFKLDMIPKWVPCHVTWRVACVCVCVLGVGPSCLAPTLLLLRGHAWPPPCPC